MQVAANGEKEYNHRRLIPSRDIYDCKYAGPREERKINTSLPQTYDTVLSGNCADIGMKFPQPVYQISVKFPKIP